MQYLGSPSLLSLRADPRLDRGLRRLLRIGIICAVLLGSAYVSRRASLDLLNLFVAIGALLVFARWPQLGPPAIVVAGQLVPFAISTGTETRLNVAVLLVGLLAGLWLLELLLRREARFVAAPPMAPLLMFVVVALLAFAAGTQSHLAFASPASLPSQLGGLFVFVLSAAAFLVVAHRLTEVRWLQWLTWSFLGVAALYIGAQWLRLVDSRGFDVLGLFAPRADGGQFWIWLVSLATGQALFNRELNPVARAALGGLAAATITFALLERQDWTSGWLPGLVAVGAIVAVGLPRLAPVVLGLAAAGLVAKWESISGLVMGNEQYSLMTRVEAWRILGEIISINPILGTGFSNYYHYTPLFPILGYAVRFNSHNNYIDLIAQTGLLGLAAYLWFVLAVGWLAWRLRHRVAPGFSRAYVYSCIGGLAGMLVAGMLGDWVLPFIYNIGIDGFRASVLGWLFLGGLVALEQIRRRQSALESKPNAPTR